MKIFFFPKQWVVVYLLVVAIDLLKNFRLKLQVQETCLTGLVPRWASLMMLKKKRLVKLASRDFPLKPRSEG